MWSLTVTNRFIVALASLVGHFCGVASKGRDRERLTLTSEVAFGSSASHSGCRDGAAIKRDCATDLPGRAISSDAAVRDVCLKDLGANCVAGTCAFARRRLAQCPGSGIQLSPTLA